ncbi:hypothetical protein [Rhodopirellula halodulae]|uniref:hypothetical protein n=1 Tax=Rhodopirellula halodulae TaxID=2894198 RepID=UPI001E609711|nr:hypothetical protein [Rhodopirellula sp. JC737]MCC9658814.1 hypothetical protein [Rhodopirellula sp. JC737]
MKHDLPTIAYSICMQNACDGPSYCAYYEAYGLEMSMDDEWPINTIVAAPPYLVSRITKAADVPSMGALAAASYPPPNGDYESLRDNGASWVIAHPSDPLDSIIQSGLNVLVCLESLDDLGRILRCKNLTNENAIFAFQITGTTSVDDAASDASQIASRLSDHGLSGAQILVSGSFAHDNLVEYAGLPGVNGLMLLDASFDRIIELLNQFTSRLESGG